MICLKKMAAVPRRTRKDQRMAEATARAINPAKERAPRQAVRRELLKRYITGQPDSPAGQLPKAGSNIGKSQDSLVMEEKPYLY